MKVHLAFVRQADEPVTLANHEAHDPADTGWPLSSFGRGRLPDGFGEPLRVAP